MDIDESSNGTIKNKTLEEWLYEKDDFDLQSFLEEDTEDAVIEEQKRTSLNKKLSLITVVIGGILRYCLFLSRLF